MIPEGTQCLRESVDISVQPRVQPSYNIYVTSSKALSLCSACNDRDVVSKILHSKTRHCFRSRLRKIMATMLKTRAIPNAMLFA